MKTLKRKINDKLGVANFSITDSCAGKIPGPYLVIPPQLDRLVDHNVVKQLKVSIRLSNYEKPKVYYP